MNEKTIRFHVKTFDVGANHKFFRLKKKKNYNGKERFELNT